MVYISNDTTHFSQNTYHVGFLKHIMQANLSNPLLYTRLVGVDFQSRYVANCEAWFSHTQESDLVVRGLRYLEGTTFVTAYLLVLVIKVSLLGVAFLMLTE